MHGLQHVPLYEMSDIDTLHKLGYHDFAKALSNFRFKIENALGELTDELSLSGELNIPLEP